MPPYFGQLLQSRLRHDPVNKSLSCAECIWTKNPDVYFFARTNFVVDYLFAKERDLACCARCRLLSIQDDVARIKRILDQSQIHLMLTREKLNTGCSKGL